MERGLREGNNIDEPPTPFFPSGIGAQMNLAPQNRPASRFDLHLGLKMRHMASNPLEMRHSQDKRETSPLSLSVGSTQPLHSQNGTTGLGFMQDGCMISKIQRSRFRGFSLSFSYIQQVHSKMKYISQDGEKL